MAIEDIKRLFHFTDSRNIPLIKESGGLYSRAKLVEMGILSRVKCGGNEWSFEADERFGMDRFVHLCLRNSHPMEYHARQDGRIVSSTFIEIDRAVLSQKGVILTPGVSNSSGIEFLPVECIPEYVDTNLLNGWIDWTDDAIKQRIREIEKFEILVPDYISVGLLHNL